MTYTYTFLPQLLTLMGTGLMIVYMVMKLYEVRGSWIVLVMGGAAIAAAFLLGAPHWYGMWTLQNITRMI